MGWNEEDLARIAATDDLHVAPFREDGKTPGTPTWIWSVVVDDGLYVRAYTGVESRWYKAAMREGAGQITAAGKTRDVGFAPVESDGPLNLRIDAAYRAKYPDSPFTEPMIDPKVRAATVRITPR